MICTQCQSIIQNHYKECPECKGKKFKREKFVVQVEEAEEVAEVVTPYAVNGDLDDVMV